MSKKIRTYRKTSKEQYQHSDFLVQPNADPIDDCWIFLAQAAQDSDRMFRHYCVGRLEHKPSGRQDLRLRRPWHTYDKKDICLLSKQYLSAKLKARRELRNDPQADVQWTEGYGIGLPKKS